MFTNNNFFNFYRFIKSGFLLDFFIKRLLIWVSYNLFVIFNIFFCEKYFIERLFLRSNSLLKYIKLFLNNFSNNFTYTFLPSALLIICLSFFFLILIKCLVLLTFFISFTSLVSTLAHILL